MPKLPDISLRILAMVGACGVYGLFGSPTPAGFGVVEILIAILLLTAINPAALLQSVTSINNPRWAMAGQALFFYGLSIPVITGLGQGHDPMLVLRDIIPFCFLLLPLFMQHWRGDLKIVAAAVAFIGVAFGLRVVAPVLMAQGNFIGVGTDPLYLSIAPTVAFACVLAGGAAGLLLYRGMTLRNVILAGVLAGLALLPLAAMVVTLQRAGIGLSLLALLILLGIAVIRKPAKAAAPLFLVVCIGIAMLPFVTEMVTSLLHKNSLVGANNRFQEAAVVFESVSQSVWSVIFGKGWGATLADPAVGGVTVNYTHNIFTTYILKTGLCGVTLLVLYLYGVCSPLLRLMRVSPIMTLALAVPLVIDLTLYASFKSLDFGLILLLTMLWARRLRETAG